MPPTLGSLLVALSCPESVPIVTKPCGRTLGRIDNGTVAAAATAHVESLVPRGGHAHTELDGVDLSTHTYALVDLAIDKAMLWQTLGSRGKHGRRDNDLRDGGAGKRAKELQPIIGARGRVTVSCATGSFGPFAGSNWNVLEPTCSPNTLPVIEPVPSGWRDEVTFRPLSVNVDCEINAAEGAVIRICTASPEVTNSATGVFRLLIA